MARASIPWTLDHGDKIEAAVAIEGLVQVHVWHKKADGPFPTDAILARYEGWGLGEKAREKLKLVAKAARRIGGPDLVVEIESMLHGVAAALRANPAATNVALIAAAEAAVPDSTANPKAVLSKLADAFEAEGISKATVKAWLAENF